jgi:hypothetical protein
VPYLFIPVSNLTLLKTFPAPVADLVNHSMSSNRSQFDVIRVCFYTYVTSRLFGRMMVELDLKKKDPLGSHIGGSVGGSPGDLSSLGLTRPSFCQTTLM